MPALTRGPSTVGMMEGAFFVGRVELLNWANETFQLNLAKVEQCTNGAVYCSVVDACHPGKVSMRKVNWMARNDPEIIANYKVLQQAFDRCGIERHVDVDKLIRGKYQDNLEMLQWMKCYFDNTYFPADHGPYDADKVRQGFQLPDWARASPAGGGPAAQQPSQRASSRRSNASSTTAEPPSARSSQAPSSRVASARGNAPATPLTGPHRGRSNSNHNKDGGDSALEQLKEESRKDKLEIEELKTCTNDLEGERDYYFGKLREIEILCQTLEEQGGRQLKEMTVKKLIQDVQTILYRRDDEDDEAHQAPPSQQ